MIVKHRRGTTQEWKEVDLVPEAGELVIEECDDGTIKCKIGSGSARFSELPYIDDKTKADLLLQIANVKNDIKDSIANLSENLLKELGTVENELKTVDTRFSELATGYKTDDARLEASLTSKLNSAVTLLENELSETTERLADAQTELQVEVDRIDARVDSAEEASTKALTDVINRFNTRYSELTNDYTIKDAKLKADLEQNFNEITNDLSGEIAEVRQQAEETLIKIDEETARIDTEITSTKDSFNNALANQTESFEAKYAELTNDYTSKDANMKASLEATFADTTERLDNEITSVAERIEVLQSELQTETARIDTLLETTKGLEDTLAASTDNFEAKYAELSGAYETGNIKLKTDLETSIAKAKDSLAEECEAKFDNIHAEITDVDGRLNLLDENINVLSSKTAEDFQNISSQIRSVTGEFETELTKRIVNLDSKLSNNLMTKANELEGEINTKLVELDNDLKAAEERLIYSIDKEKQESNAAIASINEDFSAYKAAHAIDVENLKMVDATNAADVRSFRAAYDHKVTELENTDAKIRQDISNLNEAVDSTSNTLKSLSSRLTTTEESIETWNSTLSTAQAKITARCDGHYLDINQKLDEQADKNVKIDASIEELKQADRDIASSFETLEANVAQQIEKATNRVYTHTGDPTDVESSTAGITPNSGDVIVIEDTYGIKSAYTYDKESGWVACSGKVSASNVILKNNITLAGDFDGIGNFTKDRNGCCTLETCGQSVEELLTNLLSKRIQPNIDDIEQPEVLLTVDGATESSYEVGEKLGLSYVAKLASGTYPFGPLTEVRPSAWTVQLLDKGSSIEEHQVPAKFIPGEICDSEAASLEALTCKGLQNKSDSCQITGFPDVNKIYMQTSSGFSSVRVSVISENDSNVKFLRFANTDNHTSGKYSQLCFGLNPEVFNTKNTKGRCNISLTFRLSEGYEAVDSAKPNEADKRAVIARLCDGNQHDYTIVSKNNLSTTDYTCWTTADFAITTSMVPQEIRFIIFANPGDYIDIKDLDLYFVPNTAETDNEALVSPAITGTFNSVQVEADSELVIKAIAHYKDGAIAKDNLGDISNPEIKISGGSISTTSTTIKGHRNYFYGYTTNTDFDASKISKTNTDGLRNFTASKTKPVSLTTTGMQQIIVAVPSSDKVESIKITNAVTTAPAGTVEVKREVEIPGANDYNAIPYDIFYVKNAVPEGTTSNWKIEYKYSEV